MTNAWKGETLVLWIPPSSQMWGGDDRHEKRRSSWKWSSEPGGFDGLADYFLFWIHKCIFFFFYEEGKSRNWASLGNEKLFRAVCITRCIFSPSQSLQCIAALPVGCSNAHDDNSLFPSFLCLGICGKVSFTMTKWLCSPSVVLQQPHVLYVPKSLCMHSPLGFWQYLQWCLKKSNVLQNTGNVYIQMLSGFHFASFLVLIRTSAALNMI